MAAWAIRGTSRSSTSTATTAATASPKAARKSRSARSRDFCSVIWERGNIERGVGMHDAAPDGCVVAANAGTHNPWRPLWGRVGATRILTPPVTSATRRMGPRVGGDDVKLSPCSFVLFVLRLDGFACLDPVGVGPVAQLIEISAHRQCLAAVHRDGLAVDPVAAA